VIKSGAVAERGRTKKAATKIEPVLTLKIRGPGIRSGRVSVPDLIKICEDAQNAVTRQAEALEGRKTIHPGPTTDQIRHECTLELVAIKKGSTTLQFALANPQIPLFPADLGEFGAKVIGEVADTLKALGNGNHKREIDSGVLQSLYSLGSIVQGDRITELEWIAPKRGTRKRLAGSVTRKVRERVASRLSQPRSAKAYIDGLLDMADFKPKDRKCRIDPAIGVSVMCSFGPEYENTIYALLRQPVRVHGLAKLQAYTNRIESIEIEKIEPLASLALGEGNFFNAPTIDLLAAAQGVKPLRNVKSLLGGIAADEDIEEFLSEIYTARKD
jgi:hypothetical protein